MAASSPALSNNSTEIPSAAFGSSSSAITSSLTPPSGVSTSKTLRGLNKPKCIKCGNVARSRCPFQSCKSCCAKAQNPCHIHVLKGGSNIPDKIPSTGSPKVDHQSTDIYHSANSHRVTSLRQLSNNFAQFNNLRTPARSKKPLTRKDAQLINEWRFMKLKEFRDRNIEAENEAFDRYMRNVSLLEEVFSVNSALDEGIDDGSSAMTSGRSADDSTDVLITRLKAKLRSDPVRKENLRKRMQYIVDQGIKALGKLEPIDTTGDAGDPDDMGNETKRVKPQQAERASALNELIDKVNKARNEEDLKSCFDLKSQLFNRSGTTVSTPGSDIIKENDEQATQNDVSPEPKSRYSSRKWFSTTTIDQESLCQIDSWFSSLEDVEEL